MNFTFLTDLSLTILFNNDKYPYFNKEKGKQANDESKSLDEYSIVFISFFLYVSIQPSNLLKYRKKILKRNQFHMNHKRNKSNNKKSVILH